LSPLGDPRFIGALAVLVVNDAILKDRFGNWLTGKLSDVAGLVVLPVLVATVLILVGASRRSAWRLAATVVGAWFAAMKVWRPAAEATEWLFSVLTQAPSQIVVDPTDLVGLVGLAVAARVISDPRPVVLSRQMRLALLMIAAFASLATSEADPRTNDLYVDPESGQVVVEDSQPVLYVPETFERVEIDNEGAQGWGVFATEACVDAHWNTGCFRISDSRIERQNADGSWSAEWLIDTDRGLTRKALGFGASSAEATDIMVDDDGKVHVAFAGILPIERSQSGEWSRSFSTYRPIAVAILMSTATIIALSFAIMSRRKRRTMVVLLLIGLPLAGYLGYVSGDGGLEVFPAGPIFVIAMAPGLIVAYLARRGSLKNVDHRVAWAPHPVDQLSSKLVFAGVVAAAVPLVTWRYWLVAPGWLPMLSVFLVVATVASVASRRVQLAQQASGGRSYY